MCAHLLSPQYERIVGIKSDLDKRWAGDFIQARSGLQLSATACSSLAGVLPSPGTLFVIDEAQFFPDLLDSFMRMLTTACPSSGLIAAGLSQDSRGREFGQVQAVVDLLAGQDKQHVFSEQLFAICTEQACGMPAAHTSCRGGHDPASSPQIAIGDVGQYQPVCSQHFVTR